MNISFFSCTKIEIKNDPSNLNEVTSSKFFNIPTNTDKLVLKVINEIKNRNNKKEFVTNFAINNGYPVWNKAILGKRNSNTNLNNFGGGNNPDTLLFIPLVLENQSLVNGYILATMTDSIGLSFSLAKDYKAYPFYGDTTQLSANIFALRIMIMENQVFGNTKFTITDKRLFHEQSNNYNDTSSYSLQINLNETDPTNSVLSSFCYTSCAVHVCSVCLGNDPDCPLGGTWTTCNTSCIWYDNGSGNSGGGIPSGGGGGGEIPPSFPCTPVINPSFSGQQNSGSNSVVPGGPPPPCPGPGVGWIPVPPPQTGTNIYGYSYARMAQLDSLLSANPYAVDPCDSLEILNSFGQMFQRVGNYRIPTSVQIRLDSIKNNVPNFDTSALFIQILNNAASSVVNCDFFPLKINQLPINYVTGNRYTASEFLEFFRRNLSLFSIPGVVFSPYNFDGFNDNVKFNADTINSLGAIVHIDMTLNGSVILTGYQNQYLPSNYLSHNFTLSTLVTPFDGYHPVSGNRRFGIYTDTSGGFTFYTMGVDRISKNSFVFGSVLSDFFTGSSGFEEADLLWTGMQNNVVDYINNHQGSASNYARRNYIVRPKYADIVDFLKEVISFQQLKDKLCP